MKGKSKLPMTPVKTISPEMFVTRSRNRQSPARRSLTNRSFRSLSSCVFSQIANTLSQPRPKPEDPSIATNLSNEYATCKKQRKIVLKKKCRTDSLMTTSQSRIWTLGTNRNNNYTKQNFQICNQSFRTSVQGSLDCSKVSAVRNFRVDLDGLKETFQHQRSNVYRVLSQLDHKFRDIVSVQYRPKDILDKFSQVSSIYNVYTGKNHNPCMSLSSLGMSQQGQSVETSRFELGLATKHHGV